MTPPLTDHGLHDLIALVARLQRRLRDEQSRPHDALHAAYMRPAFASTLRHVELALEAIEHAERTARSGGPARARDGARTLTLGGGPSLSLDVGKGGTSNTQASAWVRGRVAEMRRALSSALGEAEAGHLGEGAAARQRRAEADEPAFSGCTDKVAVPELVAFFQFQRLTGRLTIQAPDEEVLLEYEDGEIIHAESTAAPPGSRLGEILVRQGHVTEERLARFLDNKSPSVPLGEELRRSQMLSAEALASALEEQVQSIFNRLSRTVGCRFAFREGLSHARAERVRLNVTRLLLESARLADEEERRRTA